MPELAAAYTAYRSAGLEVLGVSEETLEVDEKGKAVYRTDKEHRKRLQGFLAEFAMPFSILLDDAEGGVWSRYGNPYIPAMFFVDTGGIVRTMYLKGGVTADSVAKGLKSILPLELNSLPRQHQEDCMHRNVRIFGFNRFVMGLAITMTLFAIPANSSAQGCMPLHFTTPSLGGEGIVFLRPHQWQLGLAVRRVATNKFFVGSAEKPSAAPFGQPVNLRLNSADLSATYAMTERTSLSLAVPLFYGTAEQTYADLQRHQVSNKGIGDISATANMWLGSPSRHPNGNVSLGLGVKAPTGSYHATGASYSATGFGHANHDDASHAARRRWLGNTGANAGVPTGVRSHSGLRIWCLFGEPEGTHR